MILDITEFSKDKPFLLIDVDGVINAINGSQNQKVYKIFKASAFMIRARHTVPEWMDRLVDHFNLVWCTMWDDLANIELAPELGLPSLPYVPCWDTQETVVEWGDYLLYSKVGQIQRFVADRPFAWIDDEIRKGELAWAEQRNNSVAPTFLLPIDPRMGLLEHHVNKLIGWAESIR